MYTYVIARYLLYYYDLNLVPTGSSRGEGEFSQAPRRLGAPISLKNTEKGVPDGFFLTSNMHKIHFHPGLGPGLLWGAYDTPSDS